MADSKTPRSRKTLTKRPQRRAPPAWALVAAAGALAVVVFVVVSLAGDGDSSEGAPSSAQDNSVAYLSQGQEHIDLNAIHVPYNSNPPTSGPHYFSPARTGIYGVDEAVPDEMLVHNLEHGHIWLSYRDADDQESIDLLVELQRENPRWIVVTYRPQNDSRIAAAAWTRLLTLDEPDEGQLRGFIERYRNRAPESIPG